MVELQLTVPSAESVTTCDHYYGVSGILVVELTYVPVAASDVQHSFLIPERTRGSLLGRAMLCKLQASFHCVPDGLLLTDADKASQAVQYLPPPNILYIAKMSPSLMSAMRPLL